MRTKTFALSAAAVLLLTSCGDGGGVGNSEALDDVEFNLRDDGQPEVVVHSPVEADEGASRVLSSGDGEQIEADNILEFRSVTANPESGDVLGHNFGDQAPQLAWMPMLDQGEAEIDNFVHNALTAEGVTVGSDLAIYFPADEEVPHDEQLSVFRLEDQYPPHARGEVQEQSGDLPQIENEEGVAPELVDHDPQAEPPQDLSSEVLIQGEGEEINDDDHVFVQYRGWQWNNGEQFDGSWSEEGEPAEPFGFSLTGGVIDGWLEGIPGHNVGDRIMLVIPPDQAYGEATGEDGTTEDGSPGGPLIFVIDVIQTIGADEVAQQQPQQPQPQQQQLPEDMSEEELQELMEQMQQGQSDAEGGDGGSDGGNGSDGGDGSADDSNDSQGEN